VWGGRGGGGASSWNGRNRSSEWMPENPGSGRPRGVPSEAEIDSLISQLFGRKTGDDGGAAASTAATGASTAAASGKSKKSAKKKKH